MKIMKRWSVVMAVLLVVTMLAGCGQAATKEFKAANETFSIQMDESWGTEDMQNDGILAIFSKDSTRGILVIQFPKNQGYSDMEDIKDAVETTFTMHSVTSAEAPAGIPGVENLSADTSGIIMEGQNEECYTIYGESDYAYYSFLYIAKKVTDKKIEQFQTTCQSFVETAPEIENNSEVAMTDTLLWFNATNAILIKTNGWDYTMFAGLPANENSQALEMDVLESSWDVTDRASADETLDWVLTEGHRADLAETMEAYGADGLADVAADDRAAWIYENYQATEDQAEGLAYWYNLYEEKGDAAIGAWDYSRAMSLCGFYYLAGYYTETEALDKSLEIANTIQGMYSSWDEFMESYFAGYEWWAEESSDERRAVYEELKAESDSPYNLDFGMTLEKSW